MQAPMEGRKRGRGMQPLDEIEVGGAISPQAIRQGALRVAQSMRGMHVVGTMLRFQAGPNTPGTELLAQSGCRFPSAATGSGKMEGSHESWEKWTSFNGGRVVRCPKNARRYRAILIFVRSTRITLIPGNFIFRNMKRFWSRCFSWGSRRVHGAPKGT